MEKDRTIVEFSSGMIRDSDEGKIDFTLVDQDMFFRWAKHMTKGKDLYGEDNWRKACTHREYKRFIASAERHFYCWKMGWEDEDHAAALLFNISAAEMVKKRMGNKPTDNQVFCPYCEQEFDSYANLYSHLQLNHEE